MTDEKPELLFSDLPVGRSFRPLAFQVTRQLVDEFMDTVGDRNPLYSAAGTSIVPPGFAAIYARLSYLQDHTMPQPEAYIGNAANLFDEGGNLVNDSTREFVARYMHAFAAWVETNTAGRKP
jgi:hypothetical protein